MVSINTNLSSLIVQNNLAKSTNALNTAIERMTTGFKINHASDNAAGYSIAQNLSSKLSSYDVASDNISSGLDLLKTAEDTISLMQAKGERLMALWTQAQNGTYGQQSIDAMNAEAQALVSEINRMYSNTEYNGIDIFNGIELPGWAEEVKEEAGVNVESSVGIEQGEVVGLTSNLTPSYNGFISDPTAKDGGGNPIDVDSLTSVAGLANFSSADAFKITSKSDLEHFRDLVNSGVDTTGKSFYLTADIDLGAVAEDVTNWTPIGYYTKASNHQEFKGTFDGNGHKITNLSINNESTSYQALFGGRVGAGATIKNLGVEGRVNGKQVTGGLVAYLDSSDENQSVIENCYSDVKVTGTSGYAGGLVGFAYTNSSISNSYATGQITVSGDCVGGLVGYANTSSSISNSYATGIVTGTTKVGGLVGQASGLVTNCYAAGNVIWSETGTGEQFGGLVGTTGQGAEIKNSYASGTVSAKKSTGGLIGILASSATISNSYATGVVTGTTYTGGLVGQAKESSSITNSYTSGTVSGTGSYTGGLVGMAHCSISNCYTTGSVTGTGYTGGLAGHISENGSITNSYSTGSVTGKNETGGLVGIAYCSISNCYTTGSVTGTYRVGGLVGYTYSSSATISDSYATGTITGTSNDIGGLVGQASGKIINSYATGSVTGGDETGGLVGYGHSITNSYATGNVTGTSSTGGLAGEINGIITNCYTTGSVTGGNLTGGLAGRAGGTVSTVAFNKTLNPTLNAVGSGSASDVTELISPLTTLQVGINGDSSSQISVDTSLSVNMSISDISSASTYNTIKSFLDQLSNKATELGAASNRLESALESTMVSIENVTSSLSTIRDADIATVSSDYIKQQILQQASATLLATANQSPAIALQLI